MSTAPHPGRKRHKKHEEEEHENHERWLVSYADMVTLLMCLFIVLFAMSQVDKAKFAALASGLSASFGAPITALPGTTPEVLTVMCRAPMPSRSGSFSRRTDSNTRSVLLSGSPMPMNTML